MLIPIEVSARHIHLSQKDLEALFGRGYILRRLKALTQPGQFAAKETLTLEANKGKLLKVRVVGPVRKQTQVELSLTDSIELGINPPIRGSGNLKASPGIVLAGPKKKIKIKQGVIIPWRHIHCNPGQARALGLKDGSRVSVRVKGKRSLTFHNVEIRTDKDYMLCMHIDTDEGNGAGIIKKSKGIIT